MAEDKLARLRKLAEVANEDFPPRKEIAESLRTIIKSFTDYVQPLFARLDSAETDALAHKVQVHERLTSVEKIVTRYKTELEGKIEKISLTPGPKGDRGMPGKPAVGKRGPMGGRGSPDGPADIVAKLSRIKTPWIEPSAVKGFDELAQSIQVVQPRPIFGVPSRGLFLYVGGKKQGIASQINLIAGTGVTIAHAPANGAHNITISSTATGGSGTVETPSGTVNSVNTSFTPSAQPSYVVADGNTYFDGFGYSWSGGNIVMSVAPSQYIRDFISTNVVTPGGAVNSVNTSYTVASDPKYVVADGNTYFEGAGFSYAAGVITMVIAPSEYIRAVL